MSSLLHKLSQESCPLKPICISSFYDDDDEEKNEDDVKHQLDQNISIQVQQRQKEKDKISTVPESYHHYGINAPKNTFYDDDDDSNSRPCDISTLSKPSESSTLSKPRLHPLVLPSLPVTIRINPVQKRTRQHTSQQTNITPTQKLTPIHQVYSSLIPPEPKKHKSSTLDGLGDPFEMFVDSDGEDDPKPPKDDVSQPFCEKYRPHRSSEVVGNQKSIRELSQWVKERKHNSSTAPLVALIHGSPGIGKTTFAHLVLKEAGYRIHEINASEGVRVYYEQAQGKYNEKTNTTEAWSHERFVRSKSAFYHEVQQVITRISLDKPCAVVLDEIDGSGDGEDDGAVGALVCIIEEAKKYMKKYNKSPPYPPIICIANEVSSKAMKRLKQYAVVKKFYTLRNEDLCRYLNRVCKNEKIKLTDTQIIDIIKAAGGDARRMCVLLESYVTSQGQDMKTVLESSTKDQNQNIFETLKNVLYNSRMNIQDGVRMFRSEHDKMQLMLDENIPMWITGKGIQTQQHQLDDMALMYDSLSDATYLESCAPSYQNPLSEELQTWIEVGSVMAVRKPNYQQMYAPQLKFTSFFDNQRALKSNTNELSLVKGVFGGSASTLMDTMQYIDVLQLVATTNNLGESRNMLEEYGFTNSNFESVLAYKPFAKPDPKNSPNPKKRKTASNTFRKSTDLITTKKRKKAPRVSKAAMNKMNKMNLSIQ